MQFIDKHGWPVEMFRGRPIMNFIRRILHTRKVRFGVWYNCPECGKEQKQKVKIDHYTYMEKLCWDCLGKGVVGTLSSQTHDRSDDSNQGCCSCDGQRDN